MAISIDEPIIELTRSLRLKLPEHFPPGALRRCLRLGLVEELTIFAREIIPLTEPLFTVRPRGPRPDYEKLAYAAERRMRPPRDQKFIKATQRAANIYGGRVARINPLQAWHDAQLSFIAEAHRRRGIEPHDIWVGEDNLPTWDVFSRIPDAIAFVNPLIVIEFIGHYPADRIRKLVEAYRDTKFEIELW